MNRNFLFLTSVLVLSLIAFAGCGDDENPVESQPAYLNSISITGNVYFRYDSALYVDCEIVSAVDSQPPAVNSLTVEGHAISLTSSLLDGRSTLRGDMELIDHSLEKGQEIEIIAYTPHGNDTCRVNLLDFHTDSIAYLGYANNPPWDSIDAGTALELIWTPVTDADGYFYEIEHYYDSTLVSDTAWEGAQNNAHMSFTTEENCCTGYWVFWVGAADGLGERCRADTFFGCGAVKGGLISKAGSWSLVLHVKDPPPIARASAINH